jgi:hypothetical protein
MARFLLSLTFILGFYVDDFCDPLHLQIISAKGVRNFAFKEWHFRPSLKEVLVRMLQDELSEKIVRG